MCLIPSNSPFPHWLFELTLLEEPVLPVTQFSLYRFNKYDVRLRALLSILGDNREGNKIVGIEGYSYYSQASQADTILKELGGCLRMNLCYAGHQILEIPPSAVKKIFSGDGKSNKNKMYRHGRNDYGLPDLFRLMNIGEERDCMADPAKDIPHPIEDLVDSLAVTLSLLKLLS